MVLNEPVRKTSGKLRLESCVYFEGEKAREQVLHLMEESDILLVSSPETFGLYM